MKTSLIVMTVKTLLIIMMNKEMTSFSIQQECIPLQILTMHLIPGLCVQITVITFNYYSFPRCHIAYRMAQT